MQHFADEDSMASTLLVVAVRRFGQDLLTWDPETIQLELSEATPNLLDSNYNKLMAAIRIATSDEFWTDLPSFLELCNALDGDFIAGFEPPDLETLSWGIVEAAIICPPENLNKPFSLEIIGYIQEAVRAAGLENPPEVLRVGQPTNAWNEVIETFTDDPVMFEAINAVQTAHSSEITAAVHSNLQNLKKQLKEIGVKV